MRDVIFAYQPCYNTRLRPTLQSVVYILCTNLLSTTYIWIPTT